MSRFKTLAVITARGGSKRVPGKNVRPVGGKPMIQWTCEAARKCSWIDRLIVSTDDQEIASVCRQAGVEVPFTRPAGLSGDNASSIDVLIHALNFYAAEKFDYVVLLQPTSPMRTSRHLDEAFSQLTNQPDADSIVSVFPSLYPPQFILQKENSGFVSKMIPSDVHRQRTQDMNPSYVLNGALYIAKTAFLRQNQGFLGPRTLCYEMTYKDSLDIDTEEEMAEADRLLRSHA